MSEKGRGSYGIANCSGRGEPTELSEGTVHGVPGTEARKVKRRAGLEVRFAPVAWLFGIGFAGYGVGGFLGAGVALMLPASTAFVGAWLDQRVTADVNRDRRRKTFRHRYFLWLDRRHRRREWKERVRQERQAAERDFLERRKRGGR